MVAAIVRKHKIFSVKQFRHYFKQFNVHLSSGIPSKEAMSLILEAITTQSELPMKMGLCVVESIELI